MPAEQELWKFYRPPGYPVINHEFLFQSADESDADNEDDSYEDEDGGQGWDGGGEGRGEGQGIKMFTLKLQRPQNSCMQRNQDC